MFSGQRLLILILSAVSWISKVWFDFKFSAHLRCFRWLFDAKAMAYHGLSQHVELDKLADPSERFTLENLIGEGTYGEVYSARDKKSKRRVAIKVCFVKIYLMFLIFYTLLERKQVYLLCRIFIRPVFELPISIYNNKKYIISGSPIIVAAKLVAKDSLKCP